MYTVKNPSLYDAGTLRGTPGPEPSVNIIIFIVYEAF